MITTLRPWKIDVYGNVKSNDDDIRVSGFALALGDDVADADANTALIVEAVNAYDALRVALAELLAVSAAAMRVLARHSLAEQFEHELRALQIPDGFGVRAQAALRGAKETP